MSNQINIKLFIGNIPFDCPDTIVTELFKTKPGFVSITIARRYNSVYNRGFAFATFTTEENIHELIQNPEKIMIGDRDLRLSVYDTTHKTNNKITNSIIFIKNVKIDLFDTENIPKLTDSIKQVFQSYGEVTTVKININKRTALVSYKNIEDCSRALSDKNAIYDKTKFIISPLRTTNAYKNKTDEQVNQTQVNQTQVNPTQVNQTQVNPTQVNPNNIQLLNNKIIEPSLTGTFNNNHTYEDYLKLRQDMYNKSQQKSNIQSNIQSQVQLPNQHPQFVQPHMLPIQIQQLRNTNIISATSKHNTNKNKNVNKNKHMNSMEYFIGYTAGYRDATNNLQIAINNK